MKLKKINAPSDLAINGAHPAYLEPLHVGRPNIGDRAAFMERVAGVLDRRWLTNNGPLVQEFENRVAEHLGVKHCIAICNGTIALEIAIRALGLKGEVILPSWTFVATAHALYWQGITPVFADIDTSTHNLDPTSVRRMITARTSGIIGVHLWGRAAPTDELQAIADEHGLKLMFDAAHAFGSSYLGRYIGGFGACEVFSFHATKSFNTMEGGAITTNDDELAEDMRLIRNFGFAGYDNVIHPGTNGKMIEVCAAMGLTNLESLHDVWAVNKRNYECYSNALADIPGISLLPYDPAERNSHHYVVIEVDEEHSAASRDEIVAALQAENILARKYFWPGCHGMKPYCDLFPDARRGLPETECVSKRVVVLPTGTSVSDQDIELIASLLRQIVRLE